MYINYFLEHDIFKSSFLNAFNKQIEFSILIHSNRDDSIYKRFCVVPNTWNEEKINSYLSKSLKISNDLIKLVDKQEVTVFYKSIIDNQISNVDLIDYYWNDVREFIVEIGNNHPLFCVIVIAGCDCEELDIRRIFIKQFPNMKISIDYYRDSWLSKNINI